jgi:serralysin
MLFQIVTSDQGQVSLVANEVLFVQQGVAVIDPLSYGILTALVTDDNASIRIEGTVFSALAGIDVASTTLGFNIEGVGSHKISIGATGSVTSATSAGIALMGTENVVYNYGDITTLGDLQAGVRQTGDQFTIQNFGTITGGYGISLVGNGGSAVVVNDGTISARHAAILVGTQSLTLTNTGLISVAAGSGGEAGILIQSGSLAESTIINSGVINGSVFGPPDQPLKIVNSGTINGGVAMGAKDDFFDGRGGTVTGGVAGGAGNDIYIIDDSSTVIFENLDAGIDAVGTTVSYVLDAFIENLELLGAQDINGTGNDGDNSLVGNVGANLLRGSLGNDNISGLAGDDILRGGRDRDALDGGAGDDILRGGSGKDTLRGGDGDDILNGGAGKDKLFGDDGSDVFLFAKAAHSPNGSNADQIKDFAQGEDLIDLSGLTGGNLALIGGAAFSGLGQGEVQIKTVGGNTVVRVDIQGDGTADMRITVEGVTTMDLFDFVL